MSPGVNRTTALQQGALVVLRFAIGWHLFYQGFGKLIDPKWSAAGYLSISWGPFAWMAERSWMVEIADLVTIWGLMVLGVLLMVGLFTQAAAVGSILLLLMFYIAAPPLNYSGFVVSSPEGAELWVNKAMLEILALIVIASFKTGYMVGLDILRDQRREKS